MKWPFKHLKKQSSWPMQPFVVQFAAAVLSAPVPERPAFAVKMIERCVRMGARLAIEFGMPAPHFVAVAQAMIVKEGGKEAEAAIALATGTAEVLDLSGDNEAQEAIQAHCAAIFGDNGDDTPEA